MYRSHCGRPFRFIKTSKNPYDDKGNGNNDDNRADNPAPQTTIILFRYAAVDCGVGARGIAVPDREVLFLASPTPTMAKSTLRWLKSTPFGG